MTKIDGELLRQIAPDVGGERRRRQMQIIQALSPVLADTLARYGIDNELRVAHFLAQVCHESAGFCTTVEYASGQAYEGRHNLGNTEPGDGPRFKGRGLIQLTGRANYKMYGELLDLDLVGNPDLAADPATSLLVACEYWKRHNLNARADEDDIETITRRINGGLNGIDNRRACLAKAKAALGTSGAATTATGTPTLCRGDHGEKVNALQTMLLSRGFPVEVDGDFGPVTEAVVKQFQAGHELPSDGVVGSQTWDALMRAA